MRTRKAFWNMFSSLIYQFVAIACGLITPRLLLSSFGSTYNGIVNSASQFLSMISILTIGITGATRVALYKTLASKDILGTSRIMKATKSYMKKVALCVIAYAIILSVVYPFISHNELSRGENALLILIVSIGTFAEYFFGIANQNLLQADQASYVTNIINISKTILNTIFVAILIHDGCTIYTVKLGSSIVYLISPFILNIYVQKKYNLSNKCEPDNTGIKQRGAVAFHSIANLIHGNTDLIVLTIFTDAKLISVYTVFYLVIGKIKSLMQVFTNGMEAAFGDMWVKKEHESLNRNFRAFEYMLYAFTAVVFSCVGVLILPFIAVYTRGVTDVNYIRVDLAVLITIAEAMYCIRQPYLTLVYATGSYEQTKMGALIEAIINIFLSVILVFFIGIVGVIIGTLVANVFRTMQFSLFISKNILKRNYACIIKRFIWLIVTCNIIVILALLFQSKFEFSLTWNGWLIESGIVFSIASVVTILMSIVFYKSDLCYLFKMLRRIKR